MDPYGSVWSLGTPWGLPGASWGPGGPRKGVKGGSPPGGARGALLGGLPISLRGILTSMPLGLLMVVEACRQTLAFRVDETCFGNLANLRNPVDPLETV